MQARIASALPLPFVQRPDRAGCSAKHSRLVIGEVWSCGLIARSRCPWRALPCSDYLCSPPNVRAGFPNPADDHLEQRIDLNDFLTPHPDASFLLRVAGESMIDAGIYPDDVVVIDRSLTVQQRDVVVAEVEGEFLIKRFLRENGKIILASENPLFKPLVFTGEMELTIFGVVTFTLHRHLSRRWRR